MPRTQFAYRGLFARVQDVSGQVGWTKTGTVVHLTVATDTVAIGDNAMVGGEKVRIVGGLRIDDPAPSLLAYLEMTDGSNIAVSNANEGRLRYDETTNQFEVSVNGGAYVDILTAGGWTDTGAVVRLTNIADTVAIGAAAMVGGEKVLIVGDLRMQGDVTFDSSADRTVSMADAGVGDFYIQGTDAPAGIASDLYLRAGLGAIASGVLEIRDPTSAYRVRIQNNGDLDLRGNATVLVSVTGQNVMTGTSSAAQFDVPVWIPDSANDYIRFGLAPGSGAGSAASDGLVRAPTTNLELVTVRNSTDTGDIEVLERYGASSVRLGSTTLSVLDIRATNVYFNGTGGLVIGMGQRWKQTTVAASPFAPTTADHTLLIDLATIGGPSTINLPAAAAGQMLEIKDYQGTCNVNNITINPNGVQTIDGAGVLVLNVAYQSVTLQGISGLGWAIL